MKGKYKGRQDSSTEGNEGEGKGRRRRRKGKVCMGDEV